MKLKKLLFLAALGLTATATLTSCEDILGHWERPTGAAVTPSVIYAFSLQDLSEAAITATALKVTDQAGTEIATAESDGKYTINSTAIGSATTDLWLEATTAESKKYIAKAKVSELSTISESGKLNMATLGNIIGADGKFYADKTAVDGASTTGAAMIVYLGNEGETNTTYNHGLAIALSDANSGCNWSSGGDAGLTKYTSWCSETPAATDANTDMAGIANTAYLKGKGAAYEAATNADEYSVAGFTPATYGFSGWFLPSAGQWYKFFNGMCGLTWSPGIGSAAGSYSDNFAAVNKAFGDAEYDTAKFGDDSNYWSSSEYAASNAVSVDFTSSHGGVIVDNVSKSPTTNRVRSFLAF